MGCNKMTDTVEKLAVHVAPPADRKLSWVPNPPPPPPAHGLQTVAGKAAPADRKLSAWVPNPPPPGKVPVVVPPRSHCKALPFMILTCSSFVFSRDGTCGSWTLRFKSCEAAVGEIVPDKMPVVGRKDEVGEHTAVAFNMLLGEPFENINVFSGMGVPLKYVVGGRKEMESEVETHEGDIESPWLSDSGSEGSAQGSPTEVASMEEVAVETEVSSMEEVAVEP